MSKFKFDKFIKDIAKRETAAKRMPETQQENIEETPQRKYNKLYRERWQNSIRYGKKK